MQTKRWKTLAAAFALVALPAHAYTLQVFNANVWGTSDATLEVQGFVLEDFEDTTLAPGLQVQLSGVASGAYGPVSVLPATFDPITDDPNGQKVFIGGTWDGTHVLLNHQHGVMEAAYGTSNNFVNWGDVTFTFAEGVRSVGFSVQQMELAGNTLSVNGTDVLSSNLLGTMPGGSLQRNGYIRIDAGPGETIFSLTVANNGGDGIAFDHLAFNPAPIPEPGAWALMLGGIGLVGYAARRRHG